MNITERIIAIIAPHECIVCGREGELLCGLCARSTLLPIPSRCYRCKRLTDNYKTCKKCRKSSPLVQVIVRTSYEDVAKELLYKIKFERAQSGAATIAKEMAVLTDYLEPADTIIPIPTASVRRRQRGYDQAELIAKTLSHHANLPMYKVLSRVGSARQVGTKRAMRIAQMNDAFLVWGDVAGKHIVLIDDVVTTGATLESAARVLRAHGAKRVSALVFAAA